MRLRETQSARNSIFRAPSVPRSLVNGSSSKSKRKRLRKMSSSCGPISAGISANRRGTEITKRCPRGCDLQIAIGDGLSVRAVASQIPALLPLLIEGASARGWKVGQSFVIRHCRVGILNQVGELLSPQVAVLLIGERPGLATAESLSAYMAYRPRASHTDAHRNLISNIHARGVHPQLAATRILNLAARMMEVHASGCDVREPGPSLEGGVSA